jgi:hypothetical protein
MDDQPKATSYRDLIVWQKSIVLVKQIYKLTSIFPSEEKFGLISQLRRAAALLRDKHAEQPVISYISFQMLKARSQRSKRN